MILRTAPSVVSEATGFRFASDAKPCLETIDDKIQEGYQRSAQDLGAATDTWLNAWSDVLQLCDAAGITTIRGFDGQFPMTQSLFNWHQDLEMELGNAGLDDSAKLRARISVGDEVLRRFTDCDQLAVENWRRAIAEAWFWLGDTDRADQMYHRWLDHDPQWGYGWIGWAHGHIPPARTGAPTDYQRAEDLLRQGTPSTECETATRSPNGNNEPQRRRTHAIHLNPPRAQRPRIQQRADLSAPRHPPARDSLASRRPHLPLCGHPLMPPTGRQYARAAESAALRTIMPLCAERTIMPLCAERTIMPLCAERTIMPLCAERTIMPLCAERTIMPLCAERTIMPLCAERTIMPLCAERTIMPLCAERTIMPLRGHSAVRGAHHTLLCGHAHAARGHTLLPLCGHTLLPLCAERTIMAPLYVKALLEFVLGPACGMSWVSA